MSLQTDRIFFDILSSNTTLMEQLADRLYNTAIPVPDEQAANVPAPYVIITFDGFTNSQDSKDSYEGEYDNVSVSVLIVAKDREQLADLVDAIRTTIEGYLEEATESDPDFNELPADYQLSGSQINYDPDKKASYTTLTYACSVLSH